jgi:hypothetical protein
MLKLSSQGCKANLFKLSRSSLSYVSESDISGPSRSHKQLYLPATLASTIFSMQSSVLPSDARLRDWIYTLIALFLLTFIIVINLSHIRKWGEGFRIWQDWIFSKLYQYLVIDSGLKDAFQRLRAKEPNSVGEDIELEEDTAAVNQRIDGGV